tara:strand:- start:1091 stop:2146 length:1056 start_codon:yes stop_codon:yes gene_type:complete
LKNLRNKIFTVVSLDKKPGGISKMIQTSSRALSLNCQEIKILLTRSILNNQEFLKGIINIKNSFIKNISFIDSFFIKFGYIRKNIKDILKESDIIFVHNSKLLKLIRVNYPQKKIVLFFHTDKLTQFKSFIYADKIITVNTAMQKKISEIHPNKAIYIPNSLDKEKKHKNQLHKRILSYNKKKFVIGAMGRLVKKKGFEFLIKTCMEIDNIELLIAGDGKELNNLKSISSNNTNIKLLGWIKNKDLFFKKLDVFCSSSYEEPFGLVIIEAMARGIPVISTNCHGPSDIIKNNIDGLLFEKNNKCELKNAIIKLKDNVSLRKKIRINSIKKYKRKFTFGEYKKNINSILKQI